MANFKNQPRHASEGRSIAAVLKDRIDYDKNPDEDEGGLLVSSYQCGADTAWQDLLSASRSIKRKPAGTRPGKRCDFLSDYPVL